MTDTPPGHGWWKASDGHWYPPEQHADYVAPATPPQPIGGRITPGQTTPPPPPSGENKAPSIKWWLWGIVIATLVVAGAAIEYGFKSDNGDALPVSATTTTRRPATTTKPPSQAEQFRANLESEDITTDNISDETLVDLGLQWCEVARKAKTFESWAVGVGEVADSPSVATSSLTREDTFHFASASLVFFCRDQYERFTE